MKSHLKAQIETQGYAIVDGILDAHDLSALKDDYHHLLERLAWQLHDAGVIASSYAHLPFEERLTALLTQPDIDLVQSMDITLPNGEVRPETELHVSRAIYNLLRHERLLDKVEEVVGGEILANPIQHVRMKPPQSSLAPHQRAIVGQTGWHQDQGVARDVGDDTEMLTVWIAISDATEENGCLQIVPYSHLAGLATHCAWHQMIIPDPLLAGKPLPVPLKAGDALFMHRLMQHSSLPNVSDGLRWSFDLRYQPIGYPTGRDEFPGLIVRSRENPQAVQGYAEWRDSWYATRDYLAGVDDRPPTHRWLEDAPVCA